VLELELEELHHVHGRAGGAGDGDAAVAVGRIHLLHRAVADEMAARGPAVARHHHALGVAHRHDRGAVGDRQRPVDAPVRHRRLQVEPLQEAEEARAGIVRRREQGQGHGAAQATERHLP
jgi:hypothetical protein